jgi:hypothetical protein
MTLRDIYDKNPTLMGSPRMVAFYETLACIPHEERKVQPCLGKISITSDGFMIINGEFHGSVEELEDNLVNLCRHFKVDVKEVDTLMANTSDWRSGGNAYSCR